MTAALPDFSTARVLVVGDVMLDRYWHGQTGRISPEAPVPVVRMQESEDRPGGAANVALNLAALGLRPTLVGLVGADDAGDRIGHELANAGVDARLVRVPGRPTITKLRVLARHQQLLRVDFEEPFHDLDLTPLEQTVAEVVGEADVVILSDYAKGALADPQRFIRLAREAGAKVLVDPKGHEFARYQGADLLTPNLSEFEAVTGPCSDEETLVAHGRTALDALSLGALLVTRGEAGMTLIRPEGEPLHLPARAREVFDVTGAGDTVIATLGAALAADQPLPRAVALANAAAGLVVGRLGAATVSAPELMAEMAEAEEVGLGVVNEEQLQRAVAAAREKGERVVITNGCFDLLHAGHVAYLESARALGDRLIVAVNDDDSVRRLKGEGRPLNPVDRRMAVLAGLRAVDWVVPFSEDTPERLICALCPDYLVKGGDYQPDEVAGHECVRSAGGEVVILDFVDGLSTSEIVERIQRNPASS
ncbi:D-alpha,beta-D-heptose 7-phosphate 1-kinase /D-beta-D-heptose 1-phosphate adenylyltransferase [Thiohalospira halophila DSM 15071]|uniref:Bifunctional protein HldE n=1 Tax=Thiohalospira halophila DSM 15071 TaxID=1123397 RepID=A0A1I1V0E5_9GAMM|nr:bifunctional D-glycero-beta-D-manno-heptose-7-phosphate kinase/D-glycero-beta-D-manno-heptose 1-phosphate adenylyltransferase HldE [Thiohalospira halophila]SFD73750.1 D-alpha,beta-D-heptose 7-phosphate 1-kinase /D-beta-D-heptose 1-phosphate adenylyltransferase [Thiohalospira halophila DSM 15071]